MLYIRRRREEEAVVEVERFIDEMMGKIFKTI
jgi:hypothetical protein